MAQRQPIPPEPHTSTPNMLNIHLSDIPCSLAHHILKLTLYNMMRSSDDFEDVSEALNDRVGWSIELFRSSFTIHLINGSSTLMLCSLFFLFMAESIHIHYGRLSPAELKERAELIGYVTFAILFVVLDIGFVIVRIIGLVALSGSPALATGLVIVGMSPPAVLPMLAYPVRLVQRRKRKWGKEGRIESGTVADTGEITRTS